MSLHLKTLEVKIYATQIDFRMYKKFLKPVFDFVAAVIALIILSPLLIIGMILAAVSARGNPFFVHERPGYREHLIKVVKLKTMRDGLTQDGELLPNLKRITPIGKFLRTTSLDEIPQLVNVLKGELSLVGPRPLEVWYLPHYSAEQSRRHHVRPGITGLAQVSGRNRLSWEEKFKLDVQYVDEMSFLLDVKILFKTALKVFNTSEVYSDSSANTMDAFVEMPPDMSEIKNLK